jgi:hypothetical protein
VSWTNPESDLNIAGAWYKLGPAPTNDDDGTYVENAITQISNIKTTISGYHDIYVWLQDKSGNHAYLNADTGIVRFDSIPPTITPNMAANYNLGTSIHLSPNFNDSHSGINNAQLYYRKTGNSNTVGPVAFVNDTASIPSDFNTQQGIEYAIEATDNANNTARIPATGFNSIQILLAGDGGMQLDNSGQPVARHSGSTVSSYRIFSVPFVLNNKTPAAVLEDDLGAYDNTKWKFFDVQNTTINEYPNIKNSNIVNPGKGFLLLVNMADKFIDSGPGVTPKIADYNQVSLNAGWNLIGNPFDFDIPYNNLSVNGNPPEAWYHGSTGWNSGGDLKKWEGLAVYSGNAATLSITPQSGPSSDFRISNIFKEKNWGIKISASGLNSTDNDNYIGVYDKQNEEQRNIWHEPPRLPSSISLRILPQQLELNKGKITESSVLSTFIQPVNEEGNYWDFEIISDREGEKINLSFEYFAEIPEDFFTYLIDYNYNIVHEIFNVTNTINLKTNSDKKCEFRIIVGNTNFVESNTGGIALIPARFELRQNFPNPFNPSTNMIFSLPEGSRLTLEVFNLLGQKVKTLIKNKHFEQGYHTVEWDGKNEMNVDVASGMYIFRLNSGNKVNIKKGILIR